MTSTLRSAPGAPGRARLPVQSRDRRPALAALALLLVVGGGLGAGLIVYRTGKQVDVLAAATTIQPGDVVDSSDFTTVRISGAGGATVPAGAQHSFVGSVATTRIPSGALINAQMFHSKSGLLPKNAQVVGTDVATNQRPAAVNLGGGDVVAVYIVPLPGDSVSTAARLVLDNAYVDHVKSNSDGTQHVDLVIDGTVVDPNGNGATDAAEIAGAAAQDRIALALRPTGTKPQLGLTTSAA